MTDVPTPPVEPEPRRLIHFTPLRYPGGKGKLAAYVKRIVSSNNLDDGLYVEPFAGGSAVALELLFQEYVSEIWINDLSDPIYSFWKSVTEDTDNLRKLVEETPLTVEEWRKQKAILKDGTGHSRLAVGFAAFYLNRTNRSGILNGGVIGGLAQDGPWKIDARYNSSELSFRIKKIGEMRDRITVTNLDAVQLIKKHHRQWPQKTLIYLDPPYFVKGSQLYYDFYKAKDHEDLADCVRDVLSNHHWIVSYDNVPEIHKIYAGQRHLTYSIGYSARAVGQGSEVMYFSENLSAPEVAGPIKEILRAA